MAPSTSVVICSRGRPDLLIDAVNSVLAMHRLPTELVVVDQSDQPQPELAAGTLQRATSVALTYLWSPDRGLSRARNVGLAAATGEILAFLDDDMLVDADWLDTFVRALTSRTEQRDRHVISGRVAAGTPEVPGAWAPSTIADPEPASYTGRLRKDVLFAGNCAMFRSVFDVVGTFDERLGAGSSLPSAEDNDLGYRLLAAGFTLEYLPAAVAVHRAWRRENAQPSLRYDYGRGQGAFYVKHILRGDRFMLRRFAGDVYGHLARAVVLLARARLREARNDLAYTWGLVVGALGWFRAR
ncbi:glycosyltransferase family 2 protein [Pengzhenrongella sp.]|jgi:GT2 family glycosyltransferase|uniref:glycosyltransferase family 2 protein n=1 Tax=Pengzhenrongella sp. TaxID=2888820 RepID=UPI002F941C02